MKTFLVFLKEELNDKQKKIVDSWGAPHHSFSDHVFGEKGHAVNIPLQSGKPEHQKKIEGHLLVNGFKVHDYNAGIAKDKHGRNVKIGRALVKTKAPKDLVDQFANREKAINDTSDHYIKISRHPHDVGAMSTGQNWNSCMNLDDGEYKFKLKDAVHEGTHVAYLMHKNTNKPIARANLVPFQNKNGHKILRPEGSTYGSDNHEDKFKDSIRAWSEEHFPAQSKTLYTKSDEIYNDNPKNDHVISNDKETAAHFIHNPTEINDQYMRGSVIATIARHHPEFHKTILNRTGPEYSQAHDEIITNEPKIARHVYEKTVNKPESKLTFTDIKHMYNILSSHKNIAEHHFTNVTLPEIKKQYAKAKAAKNNPDADIIDIHKISRHNPEAARTDNTISNIAERNINALLQHKSVAKSFLNNKLFSTHTAMTIANHHPSLHKELLDHARTARLHGSLTYQDFASLKQAAAHKNPDTAMGLIEKGDKDINTFNYLHHPKVAKAHINSDDNAVRNKIANDYPNLAHHFLNDQNELVRQKALSHENVAKSVLDSPKVSRDHLSKILGNHILNQAIVKKALLHPSTQTELIDSDFVHHIINNSKYKHSPFGADEIKSNKDNIIRSKSIRRAVLNHPDIYKGTKPHAQLTKLFNSVEQDQD